MFSQLHIHSIYSLLDGMSSSEDYAKKAKENNHPYLAITDHGRASGWFRHNQACKKYGIKPIFGLEMYVNDTLVALDEKEKRIRKKDGHLVLLVKNKIGYENLLHLNYISNADETHFYYNPRISFEELFKYKEGIIVGSACMANYFYQYNKNGLDGEGLYRRFVEEFGDNFYTEIQLNELEEQKETNRYMLSLAEKYKVPVVLTGDVHYLEKGNDKLQTLSICIRNKDTVDNITFELESKNLHYHTEEDYKLFNKDFGYNYSEEQIEKWCSNSVAVCEKIDFEFPHSKKMHFPTFTESVDSDDSLLIKKAFDGLTEKFNNDAPPEYRRRLSSELEAIIRKGFSSYFLVLADIIEYTERNGAWVGPARGCFTHDNKVLMGDGSYKKIGDVSIGDYVISGKGNSKKCINKFEYEIEEELVEIELENGEIIECTKDHKILINNGDGDFWKKAGELSLTDNLVKIL